MCLRKPPVKKFTSVIFVFQLLLLSVLPLFIFLLTLPALCTGCHRAAPEAGTFFTAGGWDIPPAYHGNPWAPGGVGVAGGYVYEPLFIYVPLTGEYISRLGASFTESPDHKTLTVKLRKDASWQDGRPFTSKDVMTTFNIGFIASLEIWNNLESIETPGDYDVVFKWKSVSPVNTTMALTERITSPYHIFKKWADNIPDIIRETRIEKQAALEQRGGSLGKISPEKLKEIKKKRLAKEREVREILYKYHPQMPVGTGPFQVTRVTATDMTLEKFKSYWAADSVYIQKIRILRWTSNEVIWSFLMAGEVDAVTPATPYDVAQQIIKKNPGTKMIRSSDLSEFGYIFNCTRPPMSDVNFRRALAHLLDRDMIRKVAYYYSEPVTDYTTGIIKSYRGRWLSPAFLKRLTRYDFDPKKAGEILLNAGYRRDAKGFWLRPDGSKIELEIIAPAGKTDFVLSAEAGSSLMSGFGIRTQVRVIPEELFNTILTERKYDMASWYGPEFVRFAHPLTSYQRFYDKFGFIAAATGFDGKVKGPSGEVIDSRKLVGELGATVDPAKQKEIVEKLAWVTNEYLPFLSIFEKNLMIFVLDKKHVTGWPDASDPLWTTSPSGVEMTYSTIIMKGLLRPARAEEKP